MLLSCEFSKAMTRTLFLSPAVLRWRGWGSSSVSSFFYLQAGYYWKLWAQTEQMATGVRVCRMWVRAGGWRRWRLWGFGLVSQRPTATNLRKGAKREHLCSFHPRPNSCSAIFFFYPVLLFVHLLPIAVPHF